MDYISLSLCHLSLQPWLLGCSPAPLVWDWLPAAGAGTETGQEEQQHQRGKLLLTTLTSVGDFAVH